MQQSVGQWQKVFWIATAMLMFCGIIYLIFAKSEVQPWNDPENMKKKKDKKEDAEKCVAELEPLKTVENEEKSDVNKL